MTAPRNEVLSPEDQHTRDAANDLLACDAVDTEEGRRRGALVAIIDRLVSRIESDAARSAALRKVVEAARDDPFVICETCGGYGHLGRAPSGKLVACEDCGGHEDARGIGCRRSGALDAALADLDRLTREAT